MLSLAQNINPIGNVTPEHFYRAKLWRMVNGERKLIWEESTPNLVVLEGKNAYLSRSLVDGIASPVLYIGLKGAGDVDLTDTMASHAGWSEITPFSNLTREQWVPGTVADGSVDNTASVASFTINSATNIYGAFFCTDDTLGDTTGTLFGVGDFAAARAVQIGDTLEVEIVAQML